MSRVERSPITIPDGVDVVIDHSKGSIKVKGKKGTLEWGIGPLVKVIKDGNQINFIPEKSTASLVIAGTIRALIKNMVTGVSVGYERKLMLEGVGYRAQAQGNVLNLALGFSHPIKYTLPVGVTAETPSQTEIIIKSSDKQLVGQVAATIRNFRPPEPYKGKGVRYEGEIIVYKEGKKK